MRKKQTGSRKITRTPKYVAMTRITVAELDTIIRRGEEFPNNLLLVNYEKMLATKLIVTQSEWDSLDQSICYSCRVN